MSIVEITKMSPIERLETMENLWDALCHDAEKPKSPEWHEEVLDQRRKKIESGEAEFHSLEEVKAHFS